MAPGTAGAARTALDRGDLDGALTIAAEALRADPDDAELLHVAAVAATEAGHADAVRYAREFARVRPDDAAAQRGLGLALLADGALTAAAAALQRALRAAPDDTAAAVSLAHLQHILGRGDAGRALLEEIARRVPRDRDVLRALVDLCRAAGRTARAAHWAQQLVATDPTDLVALLDASELHLELGEYEAARAGFDHLLRVDAEPGHAVYLHHGRIQTELRAGRLRTALDLAVQATAVDRSPLTTDVLAHVVAEVFGPGGRPAVPRDRLERALNEQRAAYRRLLADAVLE